LRQKEYVFKYHKSHRAINEFRKRAATSQNQQVHC
jgi:hypothetical protein